MDVRGIAEQEATPIVEALSRPVKDAIGREPAALLERQVGPCFALN